MKKSLMLTACFCFVSCLSCFAEEHNAPSIEKLRVGVESGDAEARFQLGRAYLRGEGVPKDVDKAFELMNAAAAQGHADAVGAIGYFHKTGTAVPQDDKLAAEWFRKGAEKGSAKAQLNLGKSLLEVKAVDSTEADPVRDEGVQWIKKAAEQGLADACLSYGTILYFGDHGQPKDYKNAMTYLKVAAGQGNADARNMIGSMHESGLGIPIDEATAATWYRMAAMQGHSRAQANLGAIMGPQSEEKEKRIESVAWLLMAADQNEILAKRLLEEMTPVLKADELDAAKRKSAELRKLVKK